MAAFKCPHCGAAIKFDPELGSMHCEYCGSEITLQDYSAYLKDDSNSYIARSMVCTQCGAELVTTDVTAATFCSYCGSPTLVPGRMVEEKRPDTIIPFKIPIRRAEEIYRDTVRRRFFAPEWLKSEEGIAKARGIYMPFYSYSFVYKGDFKGNASKSYTSGGYDYKETYAVEADSHANFSDLTVDASRAFPDNLSGALYPYNIAQSGRYFDPSYLAGYYADISDVKPELYGDTFRVLADRYTKGYGSVSVSKGASIPRKEVGASLQEMSSSVKTAFLPIWFLHFKNRDRISYAVINGSNGNIAMDTPVDFSKYLSVGVIVAALICLVLNFLFTLTPKIMLLLCMPMIIAGLIYANKILNMLYRSKHHLNDKGRMDPEEAETRKIRVHRDHPVLKVLLTIILTLVFWTLSAVVFSTGAVSVGMFVMFAAPFPAWWLSDRILGGSDGVLKKKKAPLYFKIYTLGKLLIALAACVWVLSWNPVEDMYFYAVGAGAMLLIIWSFFDIVRAHNKLTMREIPIFTEKRAEG